MGKWKANSEEYPSGDLRPPPIIGLAGFFNQGWGGKITKTNKFLNESDSQFSDLKLQSPTNTDKPTTEKGFFEHTIETFIMKRSFSSNSLIKSTRRFGLPSIGFSGAGFLGAYHVGVASCLLKHNHLLQPMERINYDEYNKVEKGSIISRPPLLTGVSAGAIVSAAISAGVRSDDAMNVLYEINDRTNTKSNVILNSLTPGFSLLDQVEDVITSAMQVALGGSADNPNDYDNDLLMNRIDHGKLLRIGIMDARDFATNMIKNAGNAAVKGNLEMYVYASKYRDLKDIVSASIISSYVPIGTGPLPKNTNNGDNAAVKRAFDRVKEMEELGYLKHGITDETIQSKNDDSDCKHGELTPETSINEVYYWDGGIVNMFPTIDEKTVMVTPLNCSFSNPFIAPDALSRNNRYINVDDNVSVGMNMQNMKLLLKMLRSSDPSYLDEKFTNGYDDTRKYLKERNLLTVFNEVK